MRKTSNIGVFLTFLFWPLLSLILTYRHLKQSTTQNAIWLYNVFLGLTFSFYTFSDCARYAEELKLYHSQFKFTFLEFINHVFFSVDSRIDFIQPLITYLVSLFTDSSSILLGSFGLFYGYFYSRNIWFAITRIKSKVRIEALSYFLILFILVPMWNINGFRFYAATHVFIYGFNLFVFKKENFKGLFFIIFSLFVHDTFIIAISVFFFFFLLKNKTQIIFYFYLISLIFSNIGRNFASDFFEKFSGNLLLKDRSGYLNEEYAITVQSNVDSWNWYVKYHYTLIDSLVMTSIIWIYFYRKKILFSISQNMDLFSFGLLMLGVVNFLGDIPSMKRFQYVGYLPLLLMLFIFFQETNFKRRPDWYKVLSFSITLFFFILEIWIGSINISVASIIGNPFSMYFFDFTYSVNQLIKDILN